MRRCIVIVLAGFLMTSFMVMATPHTVQATLPPPVQTSLVVMPHPDDESQAWSLVQNSASNYKVFAYMTRGEATGFCSTYPGGLDLSLGEVAPSGSAYPIATSKQGCINARLGSTFNILTKMGTVDSSLPASYAYRGTYTLPSDGTTVPDRTVNVYSGGVFGTILSFNLGDGKLTPSEVVWAIHSIQNNLSALGIPNYPIHNILGPYRNSSYAECAIYNHPDHAAIHAALFNTTFANVAYSAAPTCASDPDAVRAADVTQAAWNSLMGINSSGVDTGFFQKYYGWLTGGHWPTDGTPLGQSQVFMKHQSFWQRAG